MTSVLAVAGLVTVMLAALAGLGKAAVFAWRTVRKLTQIADDWIGEPAREDGREVRPGVLRRLDLLKYEQTAARAEVAAELAALHERVAAIEAQLQPNGSGSLRDAVDRLASPDSAALISAEQTR